MWMKKFIQIGDITVGDISEWYEEQWLGTTDLIINEYGEYEDMSDSVQGIVSKAKEIEQGGGDNGKRPWEKRSIEVNGEW